MKNCKKLAAYILLIFFLNISCDKNRNDSFGQMKAIIDGKKVEFTPDIAKVYAGVDRGITIFGRNCSEGKLAISLEVPVAVGNYTLGADDIILGFFRNSPLACPNESGGHNRRTVLEGNVSVNEVTDTRIKGTFSMVYAIVNSPDSKTSTIENGTFDVERDLLWK